MKKEVLLVVLWILIIPCFSYSADLRKASILAQKEYEKSLSRNKEVKKEVFKSRKELIKAINDLKIKTEKTEKSLNETKFKIADLEKINLELKKEEEKNRSGLDELTGSVRVSAKELETILKKSVFTGFNKNRPALLKPVLDKKRFPGIDDMKLISDLFLKEADLSGDVSIVKSEYIDKKGEKIKSEILTIGGFTSYYNEGFLTYSDKSNTFYALTKDPSMFVKSNIKKYFSGEEESIYSDISGGGALIQLTHKQNFINKIKQGGLLAWPILAIGLIAVFIGIERSVFLGRVHENTDSVMGNVNNLAEKGDWKKCHKIVGDHKKIPVYNVLRAGLKARKEDRETLESILQESILKELPRLEKFLPLLNILGAIAPLLGLLGTVTGMINTFQVITVYGTGDPRMMSGGISTALVTTMLGLMVAIPIMLLHTFLSRRVDHVIGDMEEKAVALTNIVFRDKELYR